MGTENAEDARTERRLWPLSGGEASECEVSAVGEPGAGVPASERLGRTDDCRRGVLRCSLNILTREWWPLSLLDFPDRLFGLSARFSPLLNCRSLFKPFSRSARSRIVSFVLVRPPGHEDSPSAIAISKDH